MNSKTGGNGVFQGMGWVGGSTVVLLLIGAGVALFAQQARGNEASEASVAALLLALYLASWAYVLGLLGLLFLSVRWLGDRRHARLARVAVNRYSLAPQFLQMGATPPVPSRPSREGDDRSKAISSTRVA